MPILVCSDRDGTINEDEDYYLGSNPEWRDQVRLRAGVAAGIRRLKSLPDSYFFILTSQSGVAIREFPELDEARVDQVNSHIIDLLRREGASIDGCFVCPYVSSAYVESKKGRFTFDGRYVRDHPDIKPATGMIEKARSAAGYPDASIELYVIGDRLVDMELALGASAKAVLVSSSKTHGSDLKSVEALSLRHPGRVQIAGTFDAAASWIEEDYQQMRSGR